MEAEVRLAEDLWIVDRDGQLELSRALVTRDGKSAPGVVAVPVTVLGAGLTVRLVYSGPHRP